MAFDLPHPIGFYYEAKNRQDIDTMITAFASDAVVLDEGEERQGTAAIHEWMANTTKKLAVMSEITGAEHRDGREIVTAIVSGDFPSSPVTLQYAFTLQGDRIVRLEIA